MMFLALGTALCTGLAAIIVAEVAARAGGPLVISRWRSLAGALALVVFAWFAGRWNALQMRHLPMVVGSSLSAAVLGEFFLNKAYRELGARRAGLLFASAAPFSVVIAWVFLNETPSPRNLLGIALVVSGLMLAIWFTPLHTGRNARHMEITASALAIAGGLLSGLVQAMGNAMARTALADGADPVAVMMLRAVVATTVFWSLWLAMRTAGKPQIFAPPRRVLAVLVLGAFISLALGNTLLMVALGSGPTGLVTTLAATTPVMLLPLTWWRSGRCPNVRAWCGAALTVAGIACIALS